MSQQEKNEQPEYVSDALVEAFWQPYEAFRSHTRQQVSAADAAWQEALGEARKWQDEQRQQAETFYKTWVQKNSELLFPDNSPLKKVAEQMEALAWQPLQFSLDLFDRSERALVERQQEIANTQREQANAWWNLQESFATAVKNQQRNYFRLVEDNMRAFGRA